MNQISETVFYIKDNTGAIREWAISADDNVIQIRHGQLGGAMQYQHETVEEGKQSRDIYEQVMSRMASRISKQLDKGYVNSLKKAKMMTKAKNALGLPKPMLAHKFKDVKRIDFDGAYLQRKYDGNRCLITCEGGKNFAYSRNGKPIESINHILNDIKLEEGQIIDGELYAHGESLQTIVSWIKRKQVQTQQIQYHIYDIISDDSYTRRFSDLKQLHLGPSAEVVPTIRIYTQEEAQHFFRMFRSEGYEGAIIRWGDLGYEDGKRSKSLVKMKEWHDEEFKVIDIHASSDGWAILECELSNGKTFRVSAPGSIDEKMHVLAHKEDYIGQHVTVEYSQMTKDGIPFHPVAVIFNKHC